MKKNFTVVTMALMISALIFALMIESKDPSPKNGIYLGSFNYSDEMTVEFEVINGRYANLEYKKLKDDNIDLLTLDDNSSSTLEVYNDALEFLNGKEIHSVDRLYNPGKVLPKFELDSDVDFGKLISAINNGLSRDVYKLSSVTQ